MAFGTRFWTPGSHFFVHSGFLDSISDLLDSILGLGVSIVSNLGLGGIIWASKNRLFPEFGALQFKIGPLRVKFGLSGLKFGPLRVDFGSSRRDFGSLEVNFWSNLACQK